MRTLSIALALLLVAWHAVWGLTSLVDGLRYLPAGIGLWMPHVSVAREELFYRYGLLLGCEGLFEAALRLGVILLIGGAALAITRGARRRWVGALMAMSALLHALITLPNLALVVLLEHAWGYIAFEEGSWLLSIAPSLYEFRVPLELAVISLAFVLCTAMAVVVSFLGHSDSATTEVSTNA